MVLRIQRDSVLQLLRLCVWEQGLVTPDSLIAEVEVDLSLGFEVGNLVSCDVVCTFFLICVCVVENMLHSTIDRKYMISRIKLRG